MKYILERGPFRLKYPLSKRRGSMGLCVILDRSVIFCFKAERTFRFGSDAERKTQCYCMNKKPTNSLNISVQGSHFIFYTFWHFIGNITICKMSRDFEQLSLSLVTNENPVVYMLNYEDKTARHLVPSINRICIWIWF